MRIGVLAKAAGVSVPAIRYYESIGLLPTPVRVNGRRRYDARVLRRLTVIAAAQSMGFTIAEIAMLFHGFSADTPASARWHALAAEKYAQIDALIRRAEGMKRMLEAVSRCDCPTLDICAEAFAAHAPVAS